MVNNKTRYTLGGTTDSTKIGTGFWTRAVLEHKSDDIVLTLSPEEALRPSLVTSKLYGKDNLLWLLLQYNDIIDPVAEIFPGRLMVLPHPSRIK